MPLWLADLIHRVCKQICAILLTLPNYLDTTTDLAVRGDGERLCTDIKKPPTLKLE